MGNKARGVCARDGVRWPRGLRLPSPQVKMRWQLPEVGASKLLCASNVLCSDAGAIPILLHAAVIFLTIIPYKHPVLTLYLVSPYLRCANTQPFLCNEWGPFQAIFRQCSAICLGPLQVFSGNLRQFSGNLSTFGNSRRFCGAKAQE